MKIFHIEFAKTGTSLSGGEVCMLELIREFSDAGHENILLTNDNGVEVYSKYLNGVSGVAYEHINSYSEEKRFGVFVSYVMRTKSATNLIKKISISNDDLVICHSEFFPNSIPYWYLSKREKPEKSMAFYHMKSPSLFRGYEGEFTGKFQIPQPKIFHYLINQWLYKKLMLNNATILTVNKFYKKHLEQQYKDHNIIVLENYGRGITRKIDDKGKKYDLLWLGRFHAQKGLMEFVDVVHRISTLKPDVKVAIVGDGDQIIKRKLIKKLKEYNLEANVHLAGFLTGSEKEKIYQQSRLFAMTSTYESFGQVILEAMGYGIPVVAYDLPVYDVFQYGILKIELLNVDEFSKQTLVLLNDEHRYLALQKETRSEVTNHSWKATSEKILSVYES